MYGGAFYGQVWYGGVSSAGPPAVAGEGRTVIVPAADRTVGVAARDRIVVVDARGTV